MFLCCIWGAKFCGQQYTKGGGVALGRPQRNLRHLGACRGQQCLAPSAIAYMPIRSGQHAPLPPMLKPSASLIPMCTCRCGIPTQRIGEKTHNVQCGKKTLNVLCAEHGNYWARQIAQAQSARTAAEHQAGSLRSLRRVFLRQVCCKQAHPWAVAWPPQRGRGLLMTLPPAMKPPALMIVIDAPCRCWSTCVWVVGFCEVVFIGGFVWVWCCTHSPSPLPLST